MMVCRGFGGLGIRSFRVLRVLWGLSSGIWSFRVFRVRSARFRSGSFGFWEKGSPP